MHRVATHRLDAILAPDYLAGLTTLPIDELRRRRNDCQEVEVSLSYLRRVVQGRLDIVLAEMRHRREGSTHDLQTLVDSSLVTVLDGPDSVRFRLLETIRQYASKRMEARHDGEALPRVTLRLLRCASCAALKTSPVPVAVDRRRRDQHARPRPQQHRDRPPAE